jgi:hypothetical protein
MSKWRDLRKASPTKSGYYLTHEQTYFRQAIIDLTGMVRAEPEHFVRYFDGKHFVLPYNMPMKALRGVPIDSKVLYWRRIPNAPKKEISK